MPRCLRRAPSGLTSHAHNRANSSIESNTNGSASADFARSAPRAGWGLPHHSQPRHRTHPSPRHRTRRRGPDLIHSLPRPAKLILAGSGFGIARFMADGDPDSGFGNNGVMAVSFTGTPQAYAVAVQADGGIVAVGKRTATYTEFAVARVMGGPVLEERLFAIHDANYNVTGIVDAEDGDVVERYVETPYGTVTVLNGADDKDPSVQEWSVDLQYASDWGWDRVHQGLATDAETGLVYNRARYLHTSVGRFTARDFIGYGDGMNLYQYEGGSPGDAIDASGALTYQWPRQAPPGLGKPMWQLTFTVKDCCTAYARMIDKAVNKAFNTLKIASEKLYQPSNQTLVHVGHYFLTSSIAANRRLSFPIWSSSAMIPIYVRSAVQVKDKIDDLVSAIAKSNHTTYICDDARSQDCAAGADAYVPSGSTDVYLCPKFFLGASANDDKRRADMVLHELTHAFLSSTDKDNAGQNVYVWSFVSPDGAPVYHDPVTRASGLPVSDRLNHADTIAKFVMWWYTP